MEQGAPEFPVEPQDATSESGRPGRQAMGRTAVSVSRCALVLCMHGCRVPRVIIGVRVSSCGHACTSRGL